MNNDKRNIVIIGGGFSGSMLAINLACDQSLSDYNIYIVEKNHEVPKGLAYSTNTNLHLLNVPVKNMSAFSDKPDDFLDYCHEKWNRRVDLKELGNYYLPRAFYADYLKDKMNLAKSQFANIKLVKAQAQDILLKEDHGYEVILDNNETLQAQFVVLAVGNIAYGNPRIANSDYFKSPTYVQNPWDMRYLSSLDPNKPVLIMGTAQTAIDIALVLNDHGLAAPIYMLSRHGYMSQPHTLAATKVMCSGYDAGLNIDNLDKNILKAFKQVRQAIKQSHDWRLVIDSLRLFTQKYWAGLDIWQKKRFTRHIQVIWDIHRHRLAMGVANDVNRLLGAGQIKILKGRIINIEEEGNMAKITYRRRGENINSQLDVAYVFNCTGPNFNLKTLDNELLRNLNASGFICPHEFGVGVKTSNIYNVVDASDKVLDNVYIMGPILKPQLFETVAVPELRNEVKDIADKIINQVKYKYSVSIEKV